MDKNELKKAMQTAQNLQLELVRAQHELSHKDIEASSPNGMVRLYMNAEGQYKSIKIDPKILNFSHEALEESVLQAINEVNQKAAEITRLKLAEITKQIGL